MDRDDDLDSKFRKIAINFDDFGPEVSPGDEEEEGPAFTLAMEPVLTNGQQISFAKQFKGESWDDYFLLQPENEDQYQEALRWISILSLAGARTFTDQEHGVLFVDPEGSWVDLYFEKLPHAFSDSDYSQLLWSVYSSMDLWLKDDQSGEILKTLRLVAPESSGSGPDF